MTNPIEKIQQTEELKKIEPQLAKIFQTQAELLNLTMKINTELKMVNKEFEYIIESLPHGLIATDTQGKILHFNKAVASFTQISRNQAYGRIINDIFKAEILSKEFFLGERQENYFKQLQYTNPHNQTRDLACSLVFMDSKGVIIHIEDVTLVNELKEETDRKKKLTTMGQMAATIAHEVRNPLASIKLFASTLAKEFQNDKEKLEILGYIQQSVKSANYTISNLLQHTKDVKINKSRVNITQVLGKFYTMNVAIAREQDCQLILENLPEKFINADEELINQILNNLFSNGLQALEKTSQANNKIKISLQEKQGKICIFFEDEGCGMNEVTQKKIFYPFYSTKNKGIGLGMSVVKNILNKHSAQIFIESSEGVGTRICLKFSPYN